jgi:transposase-like protein
MWVTIQGQEEEITPDKRHERSGKHVVILVAMGFWPDGRREILDGHVAKREDHAQGERFLMRLKERGVEAKQGLKMIGRDGCGGLGKALVNVYGNSLLDQRCIVHNRQNVADKASTNRKGQDPRQAKKERMEQAASMYQAEPAEMARERLRDWAPHWRPQAPLAGAPLERDFEDTLV